LNIKKKLAENMTKFGVFFEAIKQWHKEFEDKGQGHAGHGFDHSLMTAQYAVLIAKNKHLGEMGWIAGLLHSIDRFCANNTLQVGLIVEAFLKKLPIGYFTAKEIGQILQAVLEHGGPNSEQDNSVCVVLKDADRLANLGPQSIIRSGQFFPNISVCEMDFLEMKKNPAGTYQRPRSVLDNIKDMMEWEKDPRFGLRLPKAKQLAQKYFKFFRAFIEFNMAQYRETGMI